MKPKLTIPCVAISSASELKDARIAIAIALLSKQILPLAQDYDATDSLGYASFKSTPGKLTDWVKNANVGFLVQILGDKPGSEIKDVDLKSYFNVNFSDLTNPDICRNEASKSEIFKNDDVRDNVIDALWPKNGKRELTYTHLEAYLALDAELPVLFYRTTDLTGAQEAHAARISSLLTSRGATRYVECYPKRNGSLDHQTAAEYIAQAISACCPNPRYLPSANVDKFRRVKLEVDELIGRNDERAKIAKAANDSRVSVITLVGNGGIGKSTLALDWLNEISQSSNWLPGFAYTFKDSLTGQTFEGSNEFIEMAVLHFEELGLECPLPENGQSKFVEQARWLAESIRHYRIPIILDGIESILEPPSTPAEAATLRDDAIKAFFEEISKPGKCEGQCLITSHFSIATIEGSYTHLKLTIKPLNKFETAELLRQLEMDIPDDSIEFGQIRTTDQTKYDNLYKSTGGYPLDILLTASALKQASKSPSLNDWDTEFGKSWDDLSNISTNKGDPEKHEAHAERVMDVLMARLAAQKDQCSLQMMRLVSVLAPGDEQSRHVLISDCIDELSDALPKFESSLEWRAAERSLQGMGLLEEGFTAHGRIRTHVALIFKKHHDLTWTRANFVLFKQHLNDAIKHGRTFRETGQSPDRMKCVSASKLAIFYACRIPNFLIEDNGAIAIRNAYAAYMTFLKGDHKKERSSNIESEFSMLLSGSVTSNQESSDSFPHVGSYAENLSVLKGFFKGTDWLNMKEGLNDEDKAQILFDVAFALRAQGKLHFAADCYASALDIRKQIYENRKNQGNTDKIGRDLSTSFGSHAKVLIMQGKGKDAVAQAKCGTHDHIPEVNPEKSAFDYTSIQADVGAANNLDGNYNEARLAFEKSRAKEILDAKPILYAERMVQYCDYLLDHGRYEEAMQVVNKADDVLEQEGAKLFSDFRLDYAINGYAYGRSLLVCYDSNFLEIAKSQNCHEVASQLKACLHDGTGPTFDKLRYSRATQVTECYGDIKHAIHELELISRRDWLVKVYIVAAGIARVAVKESLSPTKDQYELCNSYLGRARSIADPFRKNELRDIEFKPFYVDLLIEAAKQAVMLTGNIGKVVKELAGPQVAESGHKKIADQILTIANSAINEIPDGRHRTDFAQKVRAKLYSVIAKL